VLLKKVVSWLKRGQKGPFLREICPLKKMTPKYDAASGIIAGELLKYLELIRMNASSSHGLVGIPDCFGVTHLGSIHLSAVYLYLIRALLHSSSVC
jgi:hypothetical protein